MIYTAALTCSHILFTQSFITSSSHTHRASFPVHRASFPVLTQPHFLFSHSLISCSTEPHFLFYIVSFPVLTQPLCLFSGAYFMFTRRLICCSHIASFCVDTEAQQPLYTWSQTAEDVTIQLTLPADTAKPDVYVSLSADQVDIGVKNSVALLRGPLHDRIDTSTGTWNIDGQK